jgi:hypothetical protein
MDAYDEAAKHYGRHDRAELIEKCERAGYKVLSTNYFGAFLFPGFWVVKKRNQKKYASLSYEEKLKLATQQLASTSAGWTNRLFYWVFRLENALGQQLPFPFGIRLYVLLERK